MGENAKRISDGTVVKIGSCEDMWYLRYEDRTKVSKLPNNVDPHRTDGLRWRLPFPDEDEIAIGEYTNHRRGWPLYGVSEVTGYSDHECLDLDVDGDPGTIQVHHESGLLVNLKCHHGRKMPEVSGEIKCFWNGKSYSLELTAIKNTAEGIKPIVGCRHCHHCWRFEWAEVLPYLQGEMRVRLRPYFEAAQAAV